MLTSREIFTTKLLKDVRVELWWCKVATISTVDANRETHWCTVKKILANHHWKDVWYELDSLKFVHFPQLNQIYEQIYIYCRKIKYIATKVLKKRLIWTWMRINHEIFTTISLHPKWTLMLKSHEKLLTNL
jgi:hypothetical protein